MKIHFFIVAATLALAFIPMRAHAYGFGEEPPPEYKFNPPGQNTSTSTSTNSNTEKKTNPPPDSPDDVASEHRFRLDFSFVSFENCEARLGKAKGASLGIYTAGSNGGMALIDDVPKFCRGLYPDMSTNQDKIPPPDVVPCFGAQETSG